MPFMRLIPSGNSHPTRGQYRSNTTRYRLEATHLAQTNRIAFRKKLVVLANEASCGIGSFDVASGLVADRSASPVAANTTVRKLLNNHLQHCDHFRAGRRHSFVETGLRRVGLIHVLVGSLLRSGRCSSRGDPCSGWLAWQLSQASLGMRLSSLWWCSVVLGREAINHSFAK